MMSINWLEPDWPAPNNIRALTTLRTGGVSVPPFASLNPATHVGDNPENVERNRKILRTELELHHDPIWLNQVHGTAVVQADQVNGLPTADASWTTQANVVCTVMTADCLPVLYCSTDGAVVAAAHAGWRGLLAGILTSTYLAMQKSEVLVWLGPAIGPQVFEVGPEVREAFIAKNPEFGTAFVVQDAQHYLADIYQLARIELAALGIKNIYGGDFCTYTDAQRFFSYRRDQQTGRMATLIWKT